MAQMVIEPWDALGRELKAFETAYNEVGGQDIYVEIHPDRIIARAGIASARDQSRQADWPRERGHRA